MTKKSENGGRSLLINKDEDIISLFNTDSGMINESLDIVKTLSKKYNISIRQIAELLKNRDKYISIPVGLFRSKLGPLEALVRYLKDVLEYTFAQIGRLLSRDETTIWTTYHNSMKKSDKVIVDLEMKEVDFDSLKVKQEELIVPLSIFAERKLSVLESLCLYLQENFKMNYKGMGVLLDRNERTVWTVVSRARKKLGGIFKDGGRKAPLMRGRS